MKVLLEYNPTNGEIKDANGVTIHIYFALQSYEIESKPSSEIVEKMIDAGFKSKELIELKRKDVI